MSKGLDDLDYQFGRYRFEARSRTLTRDGVVVALPATSAELLLAFLENPGRTLLKQDLIGRIWPDVYVDENNLAQSVAALRREFGRGEDGAIAIQTLPRKGYRFVAEVTVISDRSAEPFSDAPVPSASTKESPTDELPAKGRFSRRSILLAGVAVSLLTAAAYFPISTFLKGDTGRKIEAVAVTSSGNVGSAAISANGEFIVYYTVEPENRHALWLMQVSTRALTKIKTPGDLLFHDLAISPDNQYVYFSALRPGGESHRAMYRIPIIGGVPTQVAERADSAPSFAPDGERFVYRRSRSAGSPSALLIASIAGSEEVQIAEVAFPEEFNDPAWSPKGDVIAVSAGHVEGGDGNYLLIIDQERKVSRRATKTNWNRIKQVAWTEDGELVAIAARETNASLQLWRFDVGNGDASPLTSDANTYAGLSISQASGRSVALRSFLETSLWRVRLSAPQEARKISFGSGSFRGKVVWLEDDKIAFDSVAAGRASVSTAGLDGSGLTEILGETFGDSYVGGISARRGLPYSVFVSDRGGNRNVWRVGPAGADPVRLTETLAANFPDITPQGDYVYLTALGSEAEAARIYRVPIGGGTAQPLTQPGVIRSVLSPDGRMFAALVGPSATDRKLAVFDREGGEPLKVFERTLKNVTALTWAEDGRRLLYSENDITSSSIWSQELSGEANQLIDVRGEQIFGFDLSPDGSEIIFVRGFWSQDVILIGLT